MSVQKKLQSMLSSDETGTLLTREKREELRYINEAFFSKLGNVGSDLKGIAKAVTSRMAKITSAAGKAIEGQLKKLDLDNFKKEFNIKEIEDLDVKLSLIKVNSPEFFTLLKNIMLSMQKIKKGNPDLYAKIDPIFEKHVDRITDYYVKLINNAKDNPNEKQQVEMYLGILTDMLSWLDKDSINRREITGIISANVDKEALKDVGIDTEVKNGKIKVLVKKNRAGKDIKPPSAEELQKIIPGRGYSNMNRDDIAKLDAKQLQDAIHVMTNYMEAFVEIDAGSTIEKGQKMIDMEAMEIYQNVKDNLAYAKKIINRAKPAAAKPAAAKPAAPVAPLKK